MVGNTTKDSIHNNDLIKQDSKYIKGFPTKHQRLHQQRSSIILTIQLLQ
jgi:hypothetical protein